MFGEYSRSKGNGDAREHSVCVGKQFTWRFYGSNIQKWHRGRRIQFNALRTEEALSIRFPDAEFRRSRHELADVTGLLARLIDDPTIHCELPIDLRGTPFGVRIWLMLRETPAGRTTTYSALARKFRMRVCISGPIHAFVPRRELQKR